MTSVSDVTRLQQQHEAPATVTAATARTSATARHWTTLPTATIIIPTQHVVATCYFQVSLFFLSHWLYAGPSCTICQFWLFAGQWKSIADQRKLLYIFGSKVWRLA